jgi:hypothetical protein
MAPSSPPSSTPGEMSIDVFRESHRR